MRFTRAFVSRLVVLLAVLTLALPGCGPRWPKTYPVEGKVIVKGGKPIVRLVAIPRGRFTIGLLAGRLTGPGPDFLAPMGEDELTLWEGGA